MEQVIAMLLASAPNGVRRLLTGYIGANLVQLGLAYDFGGNIVMKAAQAGSGDTTITWTDINEEDMGMGMMEIMDALMTQYQITTIKPQMWTVFADVGQRLVDRVTPTP